MEHAANSAIRLAKMANVMYEDEVTIVTITSVERDKATDYASQAIIVRGNSQQVRSAIMSSLRIEASRSNCTVQGAIQLLTSAILERCRKTMENLVEGVVSE